MLSSNKTDSTLFPSPSAETVRFVFPENHELALYALGTLQSYVMHYANSWERNQQVKAGTIVLPTLKIAVHCNQRFYLALQESFPECAEYILPGMKPQIDESTIVLHEKVLDQFRLLPMYSDQWLMGQIAGTVPRMLPKLKGITCESSRPIVERRCGDLGVENALFLDTYALNSNIDTALIHAANASLIVAPQGLLTVLGTALGKSVVEITKTASHRSMMSCDSYVQVSMLSSPTFFMKSLKRGIEWVETKRRLQSDATNAETTSPRSASLPG